MPAFAIETARPEHASEIARLSGELCYPATPDEIAQRLTSLSAASHAYVAVAAAPDGRLLGWMVVERHCGLESGEQAELAGLVVSSDARRLGVGRAPVAAAEAWTRAAGSAAARAFKCPARRIARVLPQRRLRAGQNPAHLRETSALVSCRRLAETLPVRCGRQSDFTRKQTAERRGIGVADLLDDLRQTQPRFLQQLLCPLDAQCLQIKPTAVCRPRPRSDDAACGS